MKYVMESSSGRKQEISESVKERLWRQNSLSAKNDSGRRACPISIERTLAADARNCNRGRK
jgi:hypothetical protein